MEPRTEDRTLVIELRTTTAPVMAPTEPLPLAIQRISVDLLDGAIADVRTAHGASLDASIHGARKKMKRLRGVMRLIRRAVGQRVHRSENAVLRDVARTFGDIRDARVRIDTVRGIRARYGDLLDTRTFSQTERWLVAAHDEAAASFTDEVRSHAIVHLAAARARFASFPVEDHVPDSFSAIASGIHRVYRRGQAGYERGTVNSSVDDLHEWRKRVKYLRFQMETLTPIQPGLIGTLAEELDRLGETLGADHDLAVLAATVERHPDACFDDRQRHLLYSLIDADRSLLQIQARRLGRALYAEHPDDFVNRINAYWDAARP